MNCKQCGVQVEENTKFCPNCGTAVENTNSYNEYVPYSNPVNNNLNLGSYQQDRLQNDYRTSRTVGIIALVLLGISFFIFGFLAFIGLGLSIYGFNLANKVIRQGFNESGAKTLNLIGIILGILMSILVIINIITFASLA